MSAELTLIISGRAVLISLVPGRSRKRNTPFFLFSRIQQPSYRVTDERRINAHYALGRDKAIKQSSPRMLCNLMDSIIANRTSRGKNCLVYPCCEKKR